MGLERLLVGSVSHHCLSHASCPVVAVPAAVSGDRTAAATRAQGVGQVPPVSADEPARQWHALPVDGDTQALA